MHQMQTEHSFFFIGAALFTSFFLYHVKPFPSVQRTLKSLSYATSNGTRIIQQWSDAWIVCLVMWHRGGESGGGNHNIRLRSLTQQPPQYCGTAIAWWITCHLWHAIQAAQWESISQNEHTDVKTGGGEGRCTISPHQRGVMNPEQFQNTFGAKRKTQQSKRTKRSPTDRPNILHCFGLNVNVVWASFAQLI